MGNYPQHQKLAARRDEHKAIVRFLNWIDQSETYRIRVDQMQDPNPDIPFETDEQRWRQLSHISAFNDLIADFFEIDRTAFEQEKMAMLDEMRAGRERG